MALQLGTTTATCGRANVTFARPRPLGRGRFLPTGTLLVDIYKHEKPNNNALIKMLINHFKGTYKQFINRITCL